MVENREKTYVADVDRSIYDIRDVEHDAYRMESGLTPEIVDKLPLHLTGMTSTMKEKGTNSIYPSLPIIYMWKKKDR